MTNIPSDNKLQSSNANDNQILDPESFGPKFHTSARTRAQTIVQIIACAGADLRVVVEGVVASQWLHRTMA